MIDPHCIAWTKAHARLVVRNRHAMNLPASMTHEIRLRWAGDSILIDRPLNLKCTRAGSDPTIKFYVNGINVISLSVEPRYIREDQTAELQP